MSDRPNDNLPPDGPNGQPQQPGQPNPYQQPGAQQPGQAGQYPQQPNPYQQPGAQQPQQPGQYPQQPNPYQQPGAQQPQQPGQYPQQPNPYQQPGAQQPQQPGQYPQQPNPYQQPDAQQPQQPGQYPPQPGAEQAGQYQQPGQYHQGWDTGAPTGQLPQAPQVEPTSGGGGKRVGIIAGISALVLVVLAGGTFAAVKAFNGGGPQPAEALPADTLGLVTIDLDPSAKQKVEAIRTLRKFPGLRDRIDVTEKQDLRKYFFDKATESGDCKSLDWNSDIKPWLGDRLGFGAVDVGSKQPAPVIALKVSSEGKAKSGMKKIADCSDEDDIGYTFSKDYLLVSDSTSHAKDIASAAKKSALSNDADYKKWSGAAGDAGVVNFYVSPDAGELIADAVGSFTPPGMSDFGSPGEMPSGLPSDFPSDFPTDLPSDFPTTSPMAYHGAGTDARSVARTDDPTGPLKDALKKFKGLGGSIRFADGGVEIEMAAGGAKDLGGKKVGDQITKLPKDTAAAFGLSVPKDYAKNLADSLTQTMGSSTLSRVESQLGISLPDDLQSLLGDSVTLSLGGDAPSSLKDISKPGDLPLGLTLGGDPDKAKGVIDKIESRSGRSLDEMGLVTKSSDGKLTLATSSDYADKLGKDGDLGGSSTFKEVVPEADKASSIFYVDFNSKWISTIADQTRDSGGDKVAENLKPLKALGVSAWADGDTGHSLIKLTTD